ncbi:competence protein CoiA [Sphingopyxis sp. NFH-91]|uniref:competence protein CoiA n=1 Tax=Sphingopyxis sp. NFH-91 TaxID=2744457 RepID=UPI001F35A77F|nr:CoiA-like domain protein [Sphingopyxis sp. NFH-91]
MRFKEEVLQYGLVKGNRTEAKPGLRGECPTCSAAIIAKCGPRIRHHWAHFGRRQCDPWWENETLWHREWKALFPEECREIHHVDGGGEIHRADIKTPGGIYIEVQHSAMTDAERLSREAFYKNLVWIVDGRSFVANFDIYHMLPDPGSVLASDLVWQKAKRQWRGAADGIFLSVSQNQAHYPGATKTTLRGGELGFLFRIKDEVLAEYRGHHQYDWVRPRTTWLEACCPVYIDFGLNYLVRLETYDETGLPCVRLVPKVRFIAEAMSLTRATDIAP